MIIVHIGSSWNYNDFDGTCVAVAVVNSRDNIPVYSAKCCLFNQHCVESIAFSFTERVTSVHLR